MFFAEMLPVCMAFTLLCLLSFVVVFFVVLLCIYILLYVVVLT